MTLEVACPSIFTFFAILILATVSGCSYQIRKFPYREFNIYDAEQAVIDSVCPTTEGKKTLGCWVPKPSIWISRKGDRCTVYHELCHEQGYGIGICHGELFKCRRRKRLGWQKF